MAYKLVAIDMDDTLLSKGLTISQRTKEAIRAAEDRGVKVLIATGRMYSSALPHLKMIGLTGEVITYNGALLSEIKSNKTLQHRPVPLDCCHKIIKLATEEDLHLNLYLDDILYVNKLGFGAEYYEKISGIKPVLIKEDIEEFVDQASTKLLIVEKDLKKVDLIQERLEDSFGDILNITRSKPSFIEIMNKGVSKGNTLAKFIAASNIQPKDVIAIGDSYNDLDMIEYAGVGVAVANARDKVKAAADFVTSSNDEDGVAEAIEKFIL